MRIVRIVAIALVAYVGVVVLFESFLGFFQPQRSSTVVITTFGDDGVGQDRVVMPMRSEGSLYVSANHWPRSWYVRARANPRVQVTEGGVTTDYVAVPVTGAEHDRMAVEHAHPLAFRILTGFPPRYFLRLDPAGQ